jgi:aspartokinase-like uncharacterized kinase
MAALVDEAKRRPLLVVPGGGALADAVRAVTDRHEIGDGASHWMAILAMDQMAVLLADLAPSARVVGEPREIAAVVAQGRLAILAPFAWLRSEDPLPQGWHVTSDSLAAWIAGALGAERLVLLKSVAGVVQDGVLRERAEPREAVQAGLVDDYFPVALPSGLECHVVDGARLDDVRAALSGGPGRGTRLS